MRSPPVRIAELWSIWVWTCKVVVHLWEHAGLCGFQQVSSQELIVLISFPVPHTVIAGWQLEVSHSGNIYWPTLSVEAFPSIERGLLNIDQHKSHFIRGFSSWHSRKPFAIKSSGYNIISSSGTKQASSLSVFTWQDHTFFLALRWCFQYPGCFFRLSVQWDSRDCILGCHWLLTLCRMHCGERQSEQSHFQTGFYIGSNFFSELLEPLH